MGRRPSAATTTAAQIGKTARPSASVTMTPDGLTGGFGAGFGAILAAGFDADVATGVGAGVGADGG
jgi:hypothetical protein